MIIRIEDLEKRDIKPEDIYPYNENDILMKKCYYLEDNEEVAAVLNNLSFIFLDIIIARVGEEVYFTAPTHRFPIIENCICSLV